eukprot:scaffold8865_cov18-Tisochrysis_lutea.AAC.1
MLSLGGSQALRQLNSPGKSGAAAAQLDRHYSACVPLRSKQIGCICVSNHLRQVRLVSEGGHRC